MSTQLHDVDPIETQEWLDALSSVLEYEGGERAQYLLEKPAQILPRQRRTYAPRHDHPVFEYRFG